MRAAINGVDDIQPTDRADNSPVTIINGLSHLIKKKPFHHTTTVYAMLNWSEDRSTVNSLTSIKTRNGRGIGLFAKTTIPQYTIVAFFGGESCAVAAKDHSDPEMVQTYAIYWPFNMAGRVNCPKTSKEMTLHRAFLVNEPYQDRGPDGTVRKFPENVGVVEDRDRKELVLCALREIQPGEELLFFYGWDYSQRQNYFVLPPNNSCEDLVLISGTLWKLQYHVNLPHVVLGPPRRDRCSEPTFSEVRKTRTLTFDARGDVQIIQSKLRSVLERKSISKKSKKKN